MRCRGFTLVGVLILVAILAISAAAAVTAGAVLQRRAAEEELLFVGHEYRKAFKSYYESAISAQRWPGTLEDLLKDPRFPGLKRHLRKIYPDPMTGKPQWGLIAAPGGGIMGVYSLSTELPIKQALFPVEFADFESKSKYSEWVFTYTAPAAQAAPAQAGAAPGAPGATGAPASPGTVPANPGAAPVAPFSLGGAGAASGPVGAGAATGAPGPVVPGGPVGAGTANPTP